MTDHDTVEALPAVTDAAAAHGITVVPGIEITSVWKGIDVHILGYFFDPRSPALGAFLERQRADRLDRLHLMAARLAEAGSPVDIAALVESASASCPQSLGRPHVARALVDAGHAADVGDAFERFLRAGGPAFVPHRGPSPFEAVRIIRRAGGLASLAHPASLNRDDVLPDLVDAGLGAIEAYHSDHTPATVERYRALARLHGLAVSGGSDYHADAAHGASTLGTVTLPVEEFRALAERHLNERSFGDRDPGHDDAGGRRHRG